MTKPSATIPDYSTNSSMFRAAPMTEDQVLAKMHQRIATSMRHYNENIAWLTQQIESGNLDNNDLSNLSIKADKVGSHISPEAAALRALYADPKYASLIEQVTMQLPNHHMHKIAMGMTTGTLTLEQFPPICQQDVGMDLNNNDLYIPPVIAVGA